MTDIGDDARVLYCPHCGNTSVQTRLLVQNYIETFYTVPDGEKSQEPSSYTVARCETCRELLVYTEHARYADFHDTDFGDLQFPKQSAFTDSVPESVRKIYKEAVLVRNISPTAFVILARRVLEEICAEQGVAERNLSSALARLAEDNVIPTTLSQATTLIRVVGNAGAHASGREITAPQVWAIDDFIKAIIEYIYVAPNKIEEFRAKFAHFTE